VAPSEILQAMEARVMLETANMDAVINRVTDQDIDKLEKINAAYRMKLKPYFDVESLPLNLEFHRTLARIGENQFMIQYIEKINEWMAVRAGTILSRYLVQLVTDEDAQGHSQVIEALRKKNGESAKILLSNHLRWVIDYFRQHLDEFENYYMS